jgi:hypothetical protein
MVCVFLYEGALSPDPHEAFTSCYIPGCGVKPGIAGQSRLLDIPHGRGGFVPIGSNE